MTDVITPIYTQSHRDGIEAICPPGARRILDIGGSSGRFAHTGVLDRAHLRFLSRRSVEKLATGPRLELAASPMRVRKTSGTVRDPGFCAANVAGA